MMRVAVVGSNGQLGSSLIPILRHANYDVTSLCHDDIECGNPQSIRDKLKSILPAVVINCAALTDVDECQKRPDDAFRINAVGAFHIATVCADIESVCIYISTDFVFDGTKGSSYTEDDCPNPVNVYGASKWAGEALVRHACPQWLIIRTASLFGHTQHARKRVNFVDSVLRKAKTGARMQVVDNVYMSPTYACDVSQALEQLLRRQSRGLFHLTNTGRCSWFEFAEKTCAIAGCSSELERISAEKYSYEAPRPQDSSLSSREADAGLANVLRPWQQALEAYLVEADHR